jgi:hypothetical protein
MKSIVDNQIEAAEKEWLDLWKKGPTRLRWIKCRSKLGTWLLILSCKTQLANQFICSIFGAMVQP